MSTSELTWFTRFLFLWHQLLRESRPIATYFCIFPDTVSPLSQYPGGTALCAHHWLLPSLLGRNRDENEESAFSVTFSSPYLLVRFQHALHQVCVIVCTVISQKVVHTFTKLCHACNSRWLSFVGNTGSEINCRICGPTNTLAFSFASLRTLPNFSFRFRNPFPLTGWHFLNCTRLNQGAHPWRWLLLEF